MKAPPSSAHWTPRARAVSATISALMLALVCSCGGGSGTGGNLRALAEEYPTASAAAVKARLDALTLQEHYILEFVGKQFKTAVFLKSCEAQSGLTWTYLSDLSSGDCPTALAQWQQYLQFLPVGSDPYANIEIGRGDVLIYLKCGIGEIDPGSCALYQQITGNVSAQMANTSQQIIDNIGNRCRIGIDPGCYP